ncbi:MAG TPA: glycosyltransferase family 39 protein [Solirubrobacterales bacterium]|nr:glycosyltransferase family 39 protein [Solirubrobacterales bacterium]
MTLSPSRNGALWVLAFLVALGAAMRFASLDVQSFHHDEVITAMRVLPGSLGDVMHAVKASESNPPLYYVLAWGWAQAFGTDEVGLRSLTALFGTATVPLAYCIGTELAHRRAGLIAAALVAVSPMLIWYSQEARSYALLAFFCAASLLFFVRALRTRSGSDLALWALASALALCSHYFAFFAVGIEALWLLIALRARWRVVLPALAAVAAVGLALVPLISAQVNPTHIGWIEGSPLSTRFFETSVSFLVGETGHVIAEPPRERYALLPVALIGISLLLVAARGTRRERRGALLGVILGLGIAALVLLAALLGKDYVVERNLLPALLPLAVAAAIGFAVDRARRLGLLLAVALCGYWIAFGVYVTRTPNLQRPDFRAITEELGPARGPRAIVTWKLAADPVRLYLDDGSQRIYSGDWPMRTIDVISKALEGRAVTGVPSAFHPVARVRFERLTLTRYMANRIHEIPFYALKRIHTGFGFNAVVVDGQPSGRGGGSPEQGGRPRRQP